MDMLALRDRLVQMDSHFATTALKFYFTQEPLDSQKDVLEQLAQRGRNVVIETLAAGSLGLPESPAPLLMVEVMEGLSLPILHPSILIMTKLKRWCQIHTSTRPKTISKAQSDRRDINYLISWMSEKRMTIDFEGYEGKTKDILLDMVRQLRDVLRLEENTGLMDELRSVVNEDDCSSL